MPTTPAITKDLPLPVQVFNAAMERQLSLSDYAQSLGISAESLRTIVTAQLNHVEPAILERLADLYQQSPETLRDRVWIAPPQESFAAWLKRNLEGISQRALRTRVQLDAKTLKRFLNGEMLPDSDQAERIARALYIDRREVARVVTATMIHQADAERLVVSTSTSAEQRLPALTVTAASATVRPKRTRSQNATFNAEPAVKEGAAAIGAGVVASTREGEQLPRATSPRQAGTQTVDASRESVTRPEADLPRRPVARRQPGAKALTPPSAPTTTSAMDPTHESAAPRVERPRRPGARRPLETTATVSAPALTGESTIDPVPAPESDHPRRPASGRQAGTTMKTDAALPQMPPSDVNGSAFSTSRATATPTTAALPPSTTLRAAPPTTSATIGLAPAPAAVPSVVAADTTTLQLTTDEVRLIRHWRQLHPQGRRATLHYIGSLLVED